MTKFEPRPEKRPTPPARTPALKPILKGSNQHNYNNNIANSHVNSPVHNSSATASLTHNTGKFHINTTVKDENNRERFIYENLYNVDGENIPKSLASANPSSHNHKNHTSSEARPDIGIFMDSNRRDINFDNLFLNEKVVVNACGTTKYALKLVNQSNFVVPETSYIHLGTNDLNHSSPEEYLSSLSDLVRCLSEKGSDVYVSELLPRLDDNLPLTDKVNSRIRQLFPKELVIPHPRISHTHLYDEVHLRRNTNEGEKYSGVQLLAIDFYFSRYGKEPMDSRISRSLGGDLKKPRSRSNSRNRDLGR